jgi:hypothetical protein
MKMIFTGSSGSNTLLGKILLGISHSKKKSGFNFSNNSWKEGLLLS